MRAYIARIGLLGLLGGLSSGCAVKATRVADTFPPARAAAPWILAEDVWHGTLAQAEPGLAEDAEDWAPFQPTQVWLARYVHDRDPARVLTIRAFAFESPGAAQRAFHHFRPEQAKLFYAGDEGVFTKDGVLFVWGRLVFEIFGSADTRNAEFAAASVTGYIERHMAPSLPAEPR